MNEIYKYVEEGNLEKLEILFTRENININNKVNEVNY
jgi:hypothetical protein